MAQRRVLVGLQQAQGDGEALGRLVLLHVDTPQRRPRPHLVFWGIGHAQGETTALLRVGNFRRAVRQGYFRGECGASLVERRGEDDDSPHH